MNNVRKVCPKCGKTIISDKLEYCCPHCGEFFENIDNSQIMQHHENLEIGAKIEELKQKLRQEKKSANKNALLDWLKSLGIAYIVFQVLALFTTISEDGGKGIMIFCGIMFGCVILAAPTILIVNHISFNKKLEEGIKKIRGSFI